MDTKPHFQGAPGFSLIILVVFILFTMAMLCNLPITRDDLITNSANTPVADHDICLVPSNGNIDTTEYQGYLAYSYDGRLHILNLETREVQTFTGVRAMVAPDWHPYGRLIALGRGDIHILDSKSGEILTLTDSPDTLWDPSWSPDGRKLVYMQMSGERGLYILDIFSRERTKLKISFWNPGHPAWSPDGKQIAFAVEDETGLIQIYVVDLDTCSTSNECTSTQLTNDSRGQSFEPAWSPDGEKIAFSSERDGFYAIYTMNADGTNQHRLTENKPHGDNDPTWSPDGSYIAFTRWGNEAADRGISKKLYFMQSNGTNLQCVVGNGGSDPDWWVETDEATNPPLDLSLIERLD